MTNARTFTTLSLTIAGLIIAARFSVGAGSRVSDCLMPVWREEGVSVVYKNIYEKKLFVTRGDIARYVYRPALTGVEESVSIYRLAATKRGAGEYRVTYMRANERLWNCVPGTERPVSDWRPVKTTRHDAPIPESTALKIHEVWITRLEKLGPNRDDEIRGENGRQIFAAAAADGTVLRGETCDFGKKNRMLIELAANLIKYCSVSPPRRADAAARIENKAIALLKLCRN